MALSDTAIKNSKPKDKPYKMTDGTGLYLLVNQRGKYFRMDYKFQGKRKTLALGVYPIVTLKEARQKCLDAKNQLANNVDPSQHKKDMGSRQKNTQSDSLEYVAREWLSKNKHMWKPDHAVKIIRRLEQNIFPWLGEKQIGSVTAPELLATLRRVEDRGVVETAHRVKQILGQVFRYAIVTGRAERDPSADLKGALTPYRSKHMSTITNPKEVAALLRAIDGYQGHFVTRCALQLAPLVFVRPGELRQAEWKDIDLDSAEWRIPAEKMKMNKVHIVPLSTQAIRIIKEIKPLTGDYRYVFPAMTTNKRPMSNNTILAALRRMGYQKEEMSGHGFRAMASTLLHENSWPSHIIELQLAHVETNSVKAAYNHALYLDDRRKMMQWWADYLDTLKVSLPAEAMTSDIH